MPIFKNVQTQVAAVEAITGDEFYEFFARNQPVILRGGINHWRAVQTWRDDAHLDRIAGHVPICYQVAARRAYDPSARPRDARLSGFLAVYRQQPHYYINDIELPAPLAADLETHELVGAFERLDDCRRACGLFIGAGGQFSDLHFDDVDLLYMVLDGQKVFFIFDCSDLQRPD